MKTYTNYKDIVADFDIITETKREGLFGIYVTGIKAGVVQNKTYTFKHTEVRNRVKTLVDVFRGIK